MIADELCLSLHEPWASLLVYGIKRIEGRSWRTQHRGRLWIHSTSTRPLKEVVQEVEEFYVKVYALEGKILEFPSKYYTSSLLGTVNVVDCLTAEQVEAFAPASIREEVSSAHAFLCESPRVLRAPVRMRGFTGLWRLDPVLVASLELIGPSPAGDTAFSWSAIPRPADLLTRRLPLSTRARLWAERYGSGASARKPPKRAAAPPSSRPPPEEDTRQRVGGAAARATAPVEPAAPGGHPPCVPDLLIGADWPTVGRPGPAARADAPSGRDSDGGPGPAAGAGSWSRKNGGSPAASAAPAEGQARRGSSNARTCMPGSPGADCEPVDSSDEQCLPPTPAAAPSAPRPCASEHGVGQPAGAALACGAPPPRSWSTVVRGCNTRERSPGTSSAAELDHKRQR